jgi:hypothetical protein
MPTSETSSRGGKYQLCSQHAASRDDFRVSFISSRAKAEIYTVQE